MSELRKHIQPIIEPEDPWASDSLERRKVAEYLTPVIASVGQPFVISLQSPYGTGKTFFIHCWRHDLRSQGYRTVYFNAWETDFSHDALFAFMVALKRQFEEAGTKKTKEKIRKRFTELAKRAGGLLRHRALPILLKGLARKSLGDETVKEVIEAFGASEEEVADLVGTIAEEGLHAQEMAETSLKAFKDYLQEVVNELTKAETDPKKKKIIVFVDELDRCRPTYAVEVLECIKHLFSVEGLVFVLAVDDSQLQNAIASVYGPNIDGDEYLRKFVDWRFNLPEPPARVFAKFLYQRFKLAETGKFNQQSDFYDLDALARGFGFFAEGLGLSLRQQEQCFTQINLAVRSLGERENPLADSLGCFAVVRSVFPDHYHACCKGEEDIESFIALLEPSLKSLSFRGFYGSWDKFKPIFHSWFIEEEEVLRLHAEQKQLEKEYNEIQDDARLHERGRKLKARLDYVSSIMEHFRWVNIQFHLSNTTLAKIIYQRLEGAVLISGN